MAEPILLRMPFSHFCRKAEWALTAAQVPYRTLDVRLVRMRELYRINPEGTVPVLRVGAELLFGSHAVLRWAEAHRGIGAPSLYPAAVRAQVEAWESWADTTFGPAVRREAYRALYANPSLAGKHGLPLWMRTPPARRFYLGVLKILKARRFEADDPKAIRDGLAQVAAQLDRMGTGFLFAAHATAADFATAALLEPLVPAAALLGYDQEPTWATVVRHIGRVRPSATSRTGRRRIKEADWKAWAGLNAMAPPAAIPALRCECGVPDWSKA